MIDARTEFNRIFGDVVMSDNDAAWYIFKAGWNAARASGPYAPQPKGCEFCSHPLYAGLKCKNCGDTARRKRERLKEIED